MSIKSVEKELHEAKQKSALDLWVTCLKAIFDLPATVVIIHGEWKLGKTDFALFLYEELMRLGFIKKGATNIVIEDRKLLCIQNMPYLKKWMFRDTTKKLFIYDESIRGTPSRRAMSKLNVAWIQDIIPELSKGRAKLIVITQEIDFTESVFYHPTFMRGIFQKVRLKVVVLKSKLIRRRQATFYDIPRTKIKFDPYRGAPFTLDPVVDFEKSPVEQQIQYLYGKGESLRHIGNVFSPVKHPEEVARILQKSLKATLEEKIAFLYGEGLKLRQIGAEFTPSMHPYMVSKILRKYLNRVNIKLSPVTYNSARELAEKSGDEKGS